MRLRVWLGFLVMGAAAATVAPGCGSDPEGEGTVDGSTTTDGGGDGGCVGLACSPFEGGKPGCTGLECAKPTSCPEGTTTRLTGKVYDPAGKTPLYNALVYVPNAELSPIKSGISETCDRCDGSVSGKPIATALTDATGSFRLDDLPAGVDFPLVIQVGKWRRKVMIPKMDACTTRPLTDPNLTRLPKNRTEGDIPHIALTTGGADPLECLLRKIGVEDSEFGPAGSPARIHLYEGGTFSVGGNPQPVTKKLAGGADLAKSSTLLASKEAMAPYDIVLLACEGTENEAQKPEASRQALYDYAKSGGRVFASHYHHVFFSGSPEANVRGLASWVNTATCGDPGQPRCEPEPPKTQAVAGTVNTSFPKGTAMKEWLGATGSLTPEGELQLLEMRHNVDQVTAGALSWISAKNPASTPANKTAVQYMSFNTPVGAADDKVCGRVVFSDLHVGAGDTPGPDFPQGCTTKDLTPQQKALTFMLFDLSSCIQRDDLPPVVPR